MRRPRSPARRALCAALLAFAPLRALRSATASPAAPLFEGIGAYRLADASSLPLAQRYADQGMVLAFGFNPAEAARSFEAAVSIDPRSAACWWALAWALGPTINADVAPEDLPRIERAIARATALAKQAPARYQELVAVLATRHRPGKTIDEEAYAGQMRALAKRRPHDADIAFLAAEAVLNLHPYDWWESDGRPKLWTAEIESLLEQALAADPDHPGAHHYIVHLYELSRAPERGIASADRLAHLAPGSGHLVHMPAHIFMRTGRYADASAANRRSIEADERYLAQVDAQGAYRVGYVAHNHHFLWASAAMQGRSREAIAAARAAWPAACGPGSRDRSTAIQQHY
jgi:tetratricopeptide (TPR) repeat protein